MSDLSSVVQRRRHPHRGCFGPAVTARPPEPRATECLQPLQNWLTPDCSRRTLSIAGQAAGLTLARTACYGTLYTWYAKHPPATLLRSNWRGSEPLRVFASRNDPGTQLATCLMLFA